MGEGLSSGGVTGRRCGPGVTPTGPPDVCDTGALEAVLAAAMRAEDLDPQAEQRALAAFRAARETGAHQSHARRRDDWRPSGMRLPRRSLKVTLGAVFASLAVGGVAVAAIGSVGSPAGGGGADRGTTRPSAHVSGRPGDTASSATGGRPRPTAGPARARDDEARCRAYEHVRGHGKALDARVWRQLVAAAGGQDKVVAYCSEQLTRATTVPSRTAGVHRSGAGTGTTGRTGTSGNNTGASGRNSGGTDNAAGKGRTGGGKHH
ncbi:hypothetical protein [Streptomyces sp. AF1A]|uniref:hypothetical protein n=1 Tax=Streptomyces sp. AF1A TaxID=3394350 RepID=UPI0039BC220C